MAGRKDEYADSLSALGIPAERWGLLAQYLEIVHEWNGRTNLTGASSAAELVDVLVADAWRAAPLVRSGSLTDVGSGNGSPGLVLSVLRPDLRVTLLEPRARRWAFLREAARRLGREDISVERRRSDEFDQLSRTVTMRAVGLGTEALAHLVEIGGDVLVFGGSPVASAAVVHVASHPLAHQQLHIFRRVVPSDVSRET